MVCSYVGSIMLYLSDTGQIMAVHCYNEDAIAVCNATPTLELDFESVFFAALSGLQWNDRKRLMTHR